MVLVLIGQEITFSSPKIFLSKFYFQEYSVVENPLVEICGVGANWTGNDFFISEDFFVKILFPRVFCG